MCYLKLSISELRFIKNELERILREDTEALVHAKGTGVYTPNMIYRLIKIRIESLESLVKKVSDKIVVHYTER